MLMLPSELGKMKYADWLPEVLEFASEYKEDFYNWSIIEQDLHAW